MSETTDPRSRTAADIENDVENTRARVSETIEALRGSMSPNQIMDQVVDYARSSGGSEFMRNLGASVRDNPLPVMLIGAGIGWLLMSGQKGAPAAVPVALPADRRLPALSPPSRSMAQEPGLLDRVADAAGDARDMVADAAGSVKDAVTGAASSAADTVAGTLGSARSATGSVASSISDSASRLGERIASTVDSAQDAARRQTHDATRTMSDGYDTAAQGANRAGSKIQAGWGKLSHEQPLLVGALGLAVGAALGALLPSTEAENRLMGEASDAVTRQVSEVAQEQYEQAKDVVDDNVAQVKDALSGAYEDARQNLGQDGLSPRNLGESVKQAATRVADVATQASSNLADTVKETVQNVAAPAAPPESAPGMATPPPASPADSALKTPSIVVPPKV